MIFASKKLDRFRKWLSGIQGVVQRCFSTDDGQFVLAWLAPYCHANAPTTNEREQGRRDVWLRLQQFLHMNEEDLTVLYARLSPEQRHQLWNPSATYVEE